MQHKNTDEPKKANGRPKWAFMENMGSSIALIHKQNPDDVNFVIELLKLAGNGLINLVASYFFTPAAPAADPRLKERNAMPHLELVKRINDLEGQRAKVSKRIYTAQENHQTPDPADVTERASIIESINFLYFGPDNVSIKLNELFADYSANIKSLRAQKSEVEARINKIKEENKVQKKTGGKLGEVDPKDEALVNALTDNIDEIMVKMVTLVQENIREHARRRVDTFLLLCIALYKTNMKLTYIPRAPIQIGKGSEIIGTEACHAALMKQIVLEKVPPASTTLIADSFDKVKAVVGTAATLIYSVVQTSTTSPQEAVKTKAKEETEEVADMEQRIKEAIAKPSDNGWIGSIFNLTTSQQPADHHAGNPQNTSKQPVNAVKEVPIADIVQAFEYKNSYLEELLNITTDLPEVVNDFDGLLEGKFGKVSPFIQNAIKIVNRVSTGELHPLQAMNEFGVIANLFFTAMNYTYFKSENISSLLAFKQSADLVCRYEREGTFDAYYKDSTIIKKEYVDLMLGLHSMTLFEKSATLLSYRGYVDDRIMEMQRTILTADPMRVKMPEHKAKYAAEKKSKPKPNKNVVQNSNCSQNIKSGP